MPGIHLLPASRLSILALVLPVFMGCGTDYDDLETPRDVTPDAVSSAPAVPIDRDRSELQPLIAQDASTTEVPAGDIEEPFDADFVADDARIVPAEDPHQAYREAEAMFARGDAEAAIPLLQSSLAARDDFVYGHYLLGLAYRRTGEPERAVSAFAEALDLMPAHHKARVNLARCELDLGRPADALVTLSTAIEDEVISDDLRNVEGLALLDLGRLEEAEAAFMAAVEIHPQNVYALNNAGLCRIRMGRHAEAVPLLAEASLLPGAPAYVHNNLGHALEHEGRAMEAQGAFARAVDAGHPTAGSSWERVSTWLAAHRPAAPSDLHASPDPATSPDLQASPDPLAEEPLASAGPTGSTDEEPGKATDVTIHADLDHPQETPQDGSAIDPSGINDR
jgi:Flp pilus assembly protein TadD